MSAGERIGSCERCQSPLERGDLRCAICGKTTPDVGPALEAVRVQVLRCEGCGAAVQYDPAVGAPACAFCASVTHLEELVDPVEQTGAFAPFTVARADATAALKQWLGGQGFFRPADLASRASLEKLQPILWVAWVFDARCQVTWAADSNKGSLRSAWAPHSGETHLTFQDVLVSASRGLSDDEVDALVDSYSLDGLTPEPAAEVELDLASVHVESFDVQRSAARRRIVAGVESAAARRIEADHIPGSRFRNVHTSILLEGLETRRLAFPAWVLAYRYKQKLYRAVISGQDASVITGKAPWAIGRILMVVLLALAAIALVAVAAAI
ncbi:MAG: hypothetical protein P1V81_00945 [Planctomycetota bacterium]|nr:hypothetical protein [Planctomycetota bacterium]